MKRFLNLSLLAVLLMSLNGCIVTSDDPIQPEPKYTLKMSVDRMIAHLTCEGTHGTEQRADIYTFLDLAEGVSYPPSIAHQDYTLVQLALGEHNTNTGLAIEVEVDFEHLTNFTASMHTYEHDPGGVRDISRTFGRALQFDAEQGCWLFNGNCLNGSTEYPHTFKLPVVSRMHDNRCDIEYHWTFELVAE